MKPSQDDHITSAKRYIIATAWSEAAKELGAVPITECLARYRSYLYRLSNDYVAEEEFVSYAIKLLPRSQYLLERHNWHTTPHSERMVPRRVSKNDALQCQETLDELIDGGCFVTASDSQYFPLVCECIESIRSPGGYSHAQIFVVDVGLSSEQRVQLISKYANLKLVPLCGLNLPRTSSELNGLHLAALACRARFTSISTNHRYFIWIDADAWIQVPGSIVDFVDLAKRQGIALPMHPFNVAVESKHHWLNRGTLTPSQKRIILGTPAIIACCFCVDALSSIYTEYCETFNRNAKSLGLKWGLDQEVFLYLYSKYKLISLGREYAFEGNPLVRVRTDGTHDLYSNQDRLIQIYHLGGGYKNERKWNYSVHADLITENGDRRRVNTSVRFRTWPWNENKSILKQLLSWAHKH